MGVRHGLVALGLLFAVVAVQATDNLPPQCTCRKDVRCFVSLERCQAGLTPFAYESTSALVCETKPSESTPYFSCWDTPDKCYLVSDCVPPTQPPTKPPPLCKCKTDILCFDSLRQCQSGSGTTTSSNGRNSECVFLNKPVFACWEDRSVCRSSETCEIIPNGGGNQDPHFRGFDGSDYYFDGEAGQDYNIISDANLQVNAHFIRLNQLKGTYMGRLGLRFGEYSLSFDPHFGVFFNNSLMASGFVELPEASFAIETLDGRYRFLFQDDVFHLTVRVAVEQGEREEAYLNLDAALIGTPHDPHGILGQTARVALHSDGQDVPANTGFKIEGTEEDYHVVDGLLGTRFTFNKFDGAPVAEQPVTASGSRFRRSVAPLFEAIVN